MSTNEFIINNHSDFSKFPFNEISEVRLYELFDLDISSSILDLFIIKKKFSEEFLEYYQNKLNWDLISRYQKLSEEFIRKHKDKVNWNNITRFQVLSDEFKYEFKDYVDWYLIIIREYEMYNALSNKGV